MAEIWSKELYYLYLIVLVQQKNFAFDTKQNINILASHGISQRLAGGWLAQVLVRFDFPKNNKIWILPNNHFKTHLFFHFLVWGTLYRLDPGPNSGLNLKSSLERPTDKCQRTHITQNLFHVEQMIFIFFFISLSLLDRQVIITKQINFVKNQTFNGLYLAKIAILQLQGDSWKLVFLMSYYSVQKLVKAFLIWKILLISFHFDISIKNISKIWNNFLFERSFAAQIVKICKTIL